MNGASTGTGYGHHLLDPHSGWPVQNSLVSVSVVCADGLLADALSTALFVLGPGKGFPLAEQYQVPVAFLQNDGKLLKSEDMPLSLVI
jgi:thiamine biosynthesis lipoprotein